MSQFIFGGVRVLMERGGEGGCLTSEKPVEEAYGEGGTVGQVTFVGEEEAGAGKPRVLEVKDVIGG